MMLMKVLALLPALSQGLPNDCPKPSTELKLNSIIAGLFREDNMPRGSIIDVGALDGTFACFYARLASTRIVHALDPTPSNVEKFQRRYAHIFPNIQPMIAALGETRGSLSVNALPKIRNGAFMQLTNVHDAVEPQHDTGVPVYPADELFRTTWRGENLGFAHVDVEGSELSVLRGMEQRIRSDKPVFTVEVHVHFQPDFTLEMLGFIDRLDYDVFLVEETCGMRMDCRNLICFPRGRSFQSDTLDLAMSSKALVHVDARSIFEHAYPCCRQGGECCPAKSRGAKILGDPSCCYWSHVRRHLHQILPRKAWMNNSREEYPISPWFASAGSWEKQRGWRW